MKEFRMEYQVIDACPNDNIIYYGQYALRNEFPQCQTSRYQTDKVTKKVPHKVLRYILIIPRLQRLFRCQSIAQFMDFHAKNISQDNVLRMPADGYEFRCIEEKWPIFKEEPRNVKILLAADGVNVKPLLMTHYTI